MEAKEILLVEDDPRDVELTLDALEEHNLANKVIVARDGAEALDYRWMGWMCCATSRVTQRSKPFPPSCSPLPAKIKTSSKATVWA
jgi:hypothetical protein